MLFCILLPLNFLRAYKHLHSVVWCSTTCNCKWKDWEIVVRGINNLIKWRTQRIRTFNLLKMRNFVLDNVQQLMPIWLTYVNTIHRPFYRVFFPLSLLSNPQKNIANEDETRSSFHGATNFRKPLLNGASIFGRRRVPLEKWDRRPSVSMHPRLGLAGFVLSKHTQL